LCRPRIGGGVSGGKLAIPSSQEGQLIVEVETRVEAQLICMICIASFYVTSTGGGYFCISYVEDTI
jgi:hypothetical protein